MRITRREKKFWEQHLSCVRHITLDPKGPGVVRLHMIPPRSEGKLSLIHISEPTRRS